MVRAAAILILAVLDAAAAVYEIEGRITPPSEVSVTLHGATMPFESATLSDGRGRFHFRKLAPGTYTVSVFEPERGEARLTVEVGPGVADRKGRVTVDLDLKNAGFEGHDQGTTISASQLSIPDKAHREYEEAQKALSHPDVPAAVAHLKRAVEMAPQFSTAWNQLGTIAYQQRKYPEAAGYFRKALAADKNSFEPLVNLGGVLLNLGKISEALQYNRFAVLRRPNDALANAQLGMSYFLSGNLDEAQKYLTISERLDPAHFSHPQLLLAEIHMRRGETAAAIAELEDFLKRHPDDAEAPRAKEAIVRLREEERDAAARK